MKQCLVSIIFLMLVGCSLKVDNKLSNLGYDILKSASLLNVDTIIDFEDEYIYAKEYLVYKDSVLIVVNSKYKNGYFLELYDWNVNKEIAKICKLGEGPNEWLSVKVDLNGNELIVNDYIKSQAAVFNIDSLIVNPKKSNVPIRHQVIGAPTAVFYKDSLLLENPYYFHDNKQGINQGVCRFVKTKGEEIYDDRLSYEYYTRNVAVNGRIIKNEANDRIIYASMYQSNIEIYDTNLHEIKQINGPIDLVAEYVIENKEISFKNKIPYAYLDYCTDNHSFFLTYVGNYLDKEHKLNDYPNWILEFDWDGNLKNSFYLNEYILSISKGVQSGVFYVTVLNGEKNPVLLKLHR